MKIGIDARRLTKNKAGIGTYIEQILGQISKMDNENDEFILYSNIPVELNIDLKKNITIKNYNRRLGVFWMYFLVPKILKKDDIDVFWGPQHLLPKRNRYSKNIKFVLTAHDLAIHKFKKIGDWKNELIQKLFFKRSCKNADIIIADSKSTKNDLIDIFKIKEEKIKVIYLGLNLNNEYEIETEKEQEILKKFNVQDKKYIFFVSTIEPRKNIVTLIKAFEEIKNRGHKELKLILAGGLGWRYKDIIKSIENSVYKQDINLAGYISKEEKECLMHNTKCFVYPSLYEGFGFPILEAMQKGAIVVTSNISSIPEVGGEAALYLNNLYDEKELADLIQKVLSTNEEQKREIIEKGYEQVKKFTWETCTNDVLEILKNGKDRL